MELSGDEDDMLDLAGIDGEKEQGIWVSPEVGTRDKTTVQDSALWFCDEFLREESLFNPENGEDVEFLRVELIAVPLSCKGQRSFRAYINQAKRKDSKIMLVRRGPTIYKLVIIVNNKPKAPYLVLKQTPECAGDVFHAMVQRNSAALPRTGPRSGPRDVELATTLRNLVSTLRKRGRWTEVASDIEESLQAAESKLARYGDTATFVELLNQNEAVSVGYVVAVVVPEGEFVERATLFPLPTHRITRWGVVANLEATEGFMVELPQPKKLCGSVPTRPYVAVADHGIVAVQTAVPCVEGSELCVTEDAEMIACVDCELPVGSFSLGKVITSLNNVALIAVRMHPIEERLSGMDLAHEDADFKAKLALDRGRELMANGLFKQALKKFKRCPENASQLLRDLMLQERARCLDQLGEPQKAEKARQKVSGRFL